jgi:hypothetical protein
VAKIVMDRRHVEFTDQDKAILAHVFEVSKKWRNE